MACSPTLEVDRHTVSAVGGSLLSIRPHESLGFDHSRSHQLINADGAALAGTVRKDKITQLIAVDLLLSSYRNRGMRSGS